MTNMTQQFSLEHRNVLITGAAGYLGQAMATGLAEMGATVLINSRSRERAEKVVSKLRSDGLSALPAVFDVNDDDGVRQWFSKSIDFPLHGLVNNAYSGASGSIETAEVSQYRDSYEVSLVSAHRLLQQALPSLKLAVTSCGHASVVNIGSMYGIVSPDQRVYQNKIAANPPFYGAAKAALLQWTRYAACEFGSEGIRVNSISPGPFPSESIQLSNPEFVTALANKVPMGRIGQAAEVQGPLTFLISDASSFVNGANLVVDGGWTCW